MQVEVGRGEERVDVGADRIERDVAQVEESGEADDDVEAERKEAVEDRDVGDADPELALRRQDERQNCERDADGGEPYPNELRMPLRVEELLHGRCQARSATRSPSRPDGRNTSTAISTRKANTSW